MEWDQLKPGQDVMFRFLGGWQRGTVREVFTAGVSITFKKGSQSYATRVYDNRNLKPCKELKKNQSTSPDLPLFGSWNTDEKG
jgi:hypothetical protein